MLDMRRRIADAVRVTDRRSFLLSLGLIGLGCGVAALVADLAVLGLVAGIAAIAVTALSLSSANLPAGASIMLAAPATFVSNAPRPAVPPESHLLDPGTGLYNDEYFRVAVDTRVLAARRHLRPVAVVLFDVIDSHSNSAADPGPVANAIKQTLREADTACRLADGRYGFVLEDTPEDGAIWTVERLRRKLSEYQSEQTRWAGIACYPAHAFSADEVMKKAEHAFTAAREWAQDRIEVAATE